MVPVGAPVCEIQRTVKYTFFTGKWRSCEKSMNISLKFARDPFYAALMRRRLSRYRTLVRSSPCVVPESPLSPGAGQPPVVCSSVLSLHRDRTHTSRSRLMPHVAFARSSLRSSFRHTSARARGLARTRAAR